MVWWGLIVLYFVSASFGKNCNIASDLSPTSYSGWASIGGVSFGSSFTTPASATTMTSVSLWTGENEATAAIQLYSDKHGFPDTILTTITSNAKLKSTPTFDTYVLETGYDLAASTTYWIIMECTSGTCTWGTLNDPVAQTGKGTVNPGIFINEGTWVEYTDEETLSFGINFCSGTDSPSPSRSHSRSPSVKKKKKG